MLATASSDTTARLWSLETGELLTTFSSPGTLKAVAFSPDGKHLTAGGGFNTIRVWDIATRKLLYDFHAHWSEIRSLAFGADSSTLISAAWDNAARVWNLAEILHATVGHAPSPSPRLTFRVHPDWSVCAAFAPRGTNQIAAVNIMANCCVWNLDDFSFAARFKAFKKPDARTWGWMAQDSFCFSSDGSMIIGCANDLERSYVQRWGARDGRFQDAIELSAVKGDKSYDGTKLALSQDGVQLAVVSPQQGLVTLIDLKDKSTIWSCACPHGRPMSLAFSHDDATIAVGTDRGQIVLLNSKTGKESHDPLDHGTESVFALAYSPQKAVLVSGDTVGVVKLWDSSLESSVLPTPHEEKMFYADFSPDGQLLVTTGGISKGEKEPWSHEGEICLWDVESKTLITRFTAHCGSVTCGVFSPDGKSLATTGRDGKLLVWDVQELLDFGAAHDQNSDN
jgi:WD40 repeat protein